MTEQTKVTYEALAVRMEVIRKAETVTKKELAIFSRESLQLVLESQDIRIINQILGSVDGKPVLSPANRKVAGMFFVNFLPWAKEEGDVVIFTKVKAKVKDKMFDAIAQWLSDENNDIWSWMKDNVKMEQKQIDWAKKITDTIGKAIEAGEVTRIDLLKAVMAGGITSGDINELIIALAAQPDNVQAA